MHGFERPAGTTPCSSRPASSIATTLLPASGFEAMFHFRVDDAAALKGLELAMELPELYKVTVNGTPVSFAAGRRWEDPHIRAFPSRKPPGPERTTVKIVGPPVRRSHGTRECLLLRQLQSRCRRAGFPHCRSGSPGVRLLGRNRAIRSMARPCAMSPRSRPRRAALQVELGEWQGSIAEILLDGKRAGALRLAALRRRSQYGRQTSGGGSRRFNAPQHLRPIPQSDQATDASLARRLGGLSRAAAGRRTVRRTRLRPVSPPALSIEKESRDQAPPASHGSACSESGWQPIGLSSLA